MILLLSGILFTGCRSASRSKADAARGHLFENDLIQSDNSDLLPDAAGEKRIEGLARFAAGIIHEMNEEPSQAFDDFLQSALADPSNEALTLDVARRLLQRKEPAKAVELLSNAANQPHFTGLVQAYLGLAYSQLGKTDQAIAANRAAIKKMPRSLPAYQQLSQIYLQNGDPKGALAVLDEAAKQQGSDARFLITLAELYAGYGQLRKTDPEGLKQRVIETLNRAAKLELDDPSLLEKLADGYKLMGENQKALEMYTRLLEEEPELPNLRIKLFEAYLSADDKKRAAEQLEAIIRDTPTNSRAYYFLGVLAQEEENYAKAEDFLKKAVLLSPESEQFHYDLARLQINMRKPKEALDTLEKVRSKFKQNFILELYSGLACSALKRYSEAINHYTAAEVIAKASDPKPPNLHEFYYQVGSTYERKHDYAQAEKYFERCLELSPKFDQALNYYGFMCAERGVNLENARKMIEQAVEAEPKNAAYLDSLGWVLYKLKQPDQALKYLLQAIEQSKEPDPTLFDHLADVYAELKDEEKARQNWQKAVDYFRKEISKHEDDPDAASFEQLGDVYAKLNQIEQAQEAWRKSLAIEPNESVQKKLETHSSNNSSAP